MSVNVVKCDWLKYVLGISWIINGLLELQPKLLTSKFVFLVINPLYSGQTGFYKSIEELFTNIFLLNPFFFGFLVAFFQISIGLLIIFNKTNKVGLKLSIIWGVIVWILGEDAGGIFSNSYNFMMGSPGSVVLYVLFAIYLLKNYSAGINIRDDILLIISWFILWTSMVFSLLMTLSVKTILPIMSNGTFLPIWISDFNSFYQKIILSLGWSAPYLLLVLFLFISLGIFINKIVRDIVLVMGSILAICFWIVGQDAGQYYTGLMTDFNIGPLIVVLAVAIYLNHFNGLAKMTKKIEVFLT